MIIIFRSLIISNPHAIFDLYIYDKLNTFNTNNKKMFLLNVLYFSCAEFIGILMI